VASGGVCDKRNTPKTGTVQCRRSSPLNQEPRGQLISVGSWGGEGGKKDEFWVAEPGKETPMKEKVYRRIVGQQNLAKGRF